MPEEQREVIQSGGQEGTYLYLDFVSRPQGPTDRYCSPDNKPPSIHLPCFWDNMAVQTRASLYRMEHSKLGGGKISKLQKVRQT